MGNPYAKDWQAVLDSQTERECFIRVTAFLKDRQIAGFNCTSEFTIGEEPPCPYFKFTYFMVIGHPYRDGIGWFRQPVWTFTLYADGTLIWEVLHFSGPLAHDQYETFTSSRVVGLEAIKRVLRDLNHWQPLLGAETVETPKAESRV